MKKLILGVLILAVMCDMARAAEKTEINAAAGNQGGVFYVGMGAVGKAIMQDNPDIDYTMFPSAGLSNVIRVQKGQSQIGVVQSNNAYMATKGMAPLKGVQDKVLGLANLNTKAHTHIVAREDSGINSIEEIRDKKLPVRININPVGATTRCYRGGFLRNMASAGPSSTNRAPSFIPSPSLIPLT